MITLTQQAVEKLKHILSADDIPGAKVRIYVEGGGCAGFSYGFSIEDSAQEDDIIVSKENINVLIDPISMTYLQDIIVDFKNDINGERFAIKNPQAATTCGCGSSFSPY